MEKYKHKVVNAYGGSCFVPSRSEFYLDYKRGKRVKAKKGTLGIMVFRERHQAVKFLACQNHMELYIKRVTPIGKATFPDSVSSWPRSTAELRTFNRAGPGQRRYGRYCIAPPKGTECYPEVIVVD